MVSEYPQDRVPAPSPVPRWEVAGHVDVAIHCAIADLTVQVARIANALEYQLGIQPDKFPETDNDVLGANPGYYQERAVRLRGLVEDGSER
jgi:hypothetical protein